MSVVLNLTAGDTYVLYTELQTVVIATAGSWCYNILPGPSSPSAGIGTRFEGHSSALVDVGSGSRGATLVSIKLN